MVSRYVGNAPHNWGLGVDNLWVAGVFLHTTPTPLPEALFACGQVLVDRAVPPNHPQFIHR